MNVILKNVCLEVEGNVGWLIDHATCHIESGQTIAMMGPSGCGKSSLFEIIAGFRSTNGGAVFIDDVVVKPGRAPRTIGYLPQNSSDLILPWKTVEGNLKLVSYLRRRDREHPPFDTQHLLEKTRLAHRRKNHPAVLSGGERRRLVLAMVLSFCPRVILLDEPFTGVDLDLKLDLWILLHTYRLKRQTAPTVLIITHNLDEAAILADRVIFFRKGEGGARVYEANPRSAFGAPEPTDLETLYKDRLTILKDYISYLDSELWSAVESS